MIVVIDDNEDDIFLFHRLLKASGLTHKVLPFCSGEEAIKYFGRVANGGAERPVACFVDVNMPGCSGFDVVEALRSSEELDDIPAIMLSSSDDERDVTRSAAKGAQCYVVKHPSAAVFRAIVEQAEGWSPSNRMTPPPRFALAANLQSR